MRNDDRLQSTTSVSPSTPRNRFPSFPATLELLPFPAPPPRLALIERATASPHRATQSPAPASPNPARRDHPILATRIRQVKCPRIYLPPRTRRIEQRCRLSPKRPGASLVLPYRSSIFPTNLNTSFSPRLGSPLPLSYVEHFLSVIREVTDLV